MLFTLTRRDKNPSENLNLMQPQVLICLYWVLQVKVSHHLCPSPGSPSLTYKALCGRLQIVLDFELSRGDQAANQGLGSLARKHRHAKARCCFLRDFS